MSGFFSSLKSIHYYFWAHWFAIVACFAMIVVPFFILAIAPVSSAIVWCCAAVILLLEFPYCRYCFRAGSRGERCILAIEKPIYKCIVYLGFCLGIWASVSSRALLLILPGSTLTLSAVCYLVAAIKGEAPEGSASATVPPT